jgi:hypothetical protein
MSSSLDYRNGVLCVVKESAAPDQSLTRAWYPVRAAEQAEVPTLRGCPLTEISPMEGIYVDEEGNVFHLAEQGETPPLQVERVDGAGKSELETLLEASLGDARRTAQTAASRRMAAKDRGSATTKRPHRKRVTSIRTLGSDGTDGSIAEPGKGAQEEAGDAGASLEPARLNLRQKLAVVRRRLAYVQKRGYNQRSNYNYVTAADIAGAVGDILAELGVVVIPRLESISHEPARTGRAEIEHVARVVMNYTFMDVDTAEEITVKVAGEGLDPGDKAPYKAMTGALKYALLQSFLLATGDDPEEERADLRTTFGSERLITAEQARQLQGLIEETGTELERVLAYYKLSSLEQMSEATYQRALELLNRKKARQTSGENAHAPN